MNIEEKVFARCVIDKEKLSAYGFKYENGLFIYKNELMDGFDLLVTYDEKISVKVLDKEFNDEYLNYRYASKGDFAFEVATKLEEELLKMRDFLAVRLNYRSRQANYLDEYMSAVYGKVEFTFKDNPDIGVYRESGGDKWYALIMKINQNKLADSLSEEDVEIINLKVDKKKLTSLIKRKGIYPAYHMNKNNWVSVVLDDSVDDVELILMINDSYDLVLKSKDEKKYYYRKY